MKCSKCANKNYSGFAKTSAQAVCKKCGRKVHSVGPSVKRVCERCAAVGNLCEYCGESCEVKS